MTYDEILYEIRSLRLERDQADARFLIRLTEVERDHLRVILDAGCESFAQFLNEFVKSGRYEAFKAGVEKIGTEQALAIGADATVVAAQLTSGAAAYTNAVQAWRAEHGGTLPSKQTAKHLLMQVDPRKEEPQAVTRQDELARLRAENAELRAENRALKARIAKLETKSSKRRQMAQTEA